jgi:hypothetical protein
MSELADIPPGVDPSRPSPARLYDYFLGGTNNFPVDREAAEYLKAHIPDVADARRPRSPMRACGCRGPRGRGHRRVARLLLRRCPPWRFVVTAAVHGS